MKCPLDQTELLITERQGVEIDYCPTCRGVWLDRGELDKLIERADDYDRRERESERRVEPARAEPSRAEPSRAEPSRAEPSRAEPSRAEPSRDDYDRDGRNYQAPPARASGADIAGMVGDALKKQLGGNQRDSNRDYDRNYDRNHDNRHGHKKKKGGLLGELFDF